ncbi:cellobiose dehydrogenase [Cladorrhinum samala]|uniref:Cellobiose dehydrogenase n=1 Tax=Cladorrhinum samala TaxID=585594 RepID=A0AAV9HTA5_9PEZI|nr:cellobiose dehydrogenase [Cladorrhinum samala]
MGLLQLATAAFVLSTGALAAQYCDASSSICYSEWVSPEKIAFRVAIPDTATQDAAFDVLLQIQAPKSVGWAGIAWGGSMVNNPLTVAWASGTTAVVSSRRASARTYPQAYAGATYTVLPGSVNNGTHWTLNALAKGVSRWDNTRINPASNAVTLAYAQGATPPSEPANNNTRFGIHNSRAKFTQDFNAAKIKDFDAQVQKLSAVPA